MPRSTVANLESGAGNPSLVVLVKVAQALGVPIDELLASPRAMVRRWPAGRGRLAQQGPRRDVRHLVPEPVPDEMMEVLDFALGAVMGGTPPCPARASSSPVSTGASISPSPAIAMRSTAATCSPSPGNLPHSYRNADPLLPARGVSVVVLAKAGV